MIRIEGITTVTALLAAAHKAMFTHSTRKIRRNAKIATRKQKLPAKGIADERAANMAQIRSQFEFQPSRWR